MKLVPYLLALVGIFGPLSQASVAAEAAPTPVQMLNGHAVYGTPMPTGTEPLTLSQLLLNIDVDPPAKPVLVVGRIGQVCQKQGCWMMLTEGDLAARVRFGDHDFAIPTDSGGRAVVLGTLSAVELSQAQARHMAKDGGGDAEQIRGPQQEWELMATSVMILADR